MKRSWRRLAHLMAWSVLERLALRRPARPRPDDVRRIDFPTQTRRWGLTMTESLRNRLRTRWLRLRRADHR